MAKQNFSYYEVTKFNTIKEMLDIAVKEAGDKIAFKYKEDDKIVQITYSDFVQQITWLGSALTEKGFSDKHIACIGRNSYKWVPSSPSR
jgi:long-chain acyl-CoA synthetase